MIFHSSIKDDIEETRRRRIGSYVDEADDADDKESALSVEWKHYDPRRWKDRGNNEPLSQVTTSGLFLGFKMYTAQGYSPWDVRRLPVLEKFYKSCSESEIPIMNHCTPEGAITYDRDDYREFIHEKDTMEDVNLRKGKGDEEYFNEYFISPKAWEPVLQKYSKLRLCLAHFGGKTDTGRKWGIDIIEMMKDYDNLYADISSSFAYDDFKKYFMKEVIMKDENRHLKNRILFGTDWYMSLLGNDVDFPKYCRKAKAKLDEYDTSLWVRFTLINPIRFYRLTTEMKRILNNIIEEREEHATLKPISDSMIEELNKEVAIVQKAYESHQAYWQTPISCRR